MSPRIQLPAAVHAGAMAEAMDVDLTEEDKGKAPAAAPSTRKPDFDLPWVSSTAEQLKAENSTTSQLSFG